MTNLIIMLTILILVIILLIIVILKPKNQKIKTNYRTIHMLGLVFFIIGLVSKNQAMWIIGLVLFITGMTNKDKWKKTKKK